jgi:hypothetical protein
MKNEPNNIHVPYICPRMIDILTSVKHQQLLDNKVFMS